MAGVRRNLWLAGLLAAIFCIGAVVLHSTLLSCGLAVALGLAGVVVLRGERWRSGALLVAALALAAGLLDAIAGWMAPAPIGAGLVQTIEPSDWNVADPVLGYRPRASTNVHARSTYDKQTIFDVTYTITAAGTRATPPAPPGADGFLFLGDSFMFGQGLSDAVSLPGQFAKAHDFKVRTVNFSAVGYGPNHFVRVLESGMAERLVERPVKAVVTWIIPDHLGRVSGDRSWLGSSPRYVLDGSVPRHTGSFTEHRWRDPVAGLTHVAGEHFAFIKAAGMRQRQAEQAALFEALMLRLRDLAREKFNAPLVVIYSWPDDKVEPDEGGLFTRTSAPADTAQLALILARLRARGIALLSVDDYTHGYLPSRLLLPHDGHPGPFTTELLAGALKRYFALRQRRD